MKKYVIVGNGVAGTACIEGIRSTDKTGKITVVAEETHAAYCRPLISYYLEQKTDVCRMQYRDPGFYERNGVDVLYGRRAIHIRSDVKELELDDGTVLPYDALCIAAGSSPFVPPFEGLDSVGRKFSFMTLDDALSLEKALTPSTRVLIVGAGLIGLKCAEGILGRVASVTVCDLADRVLSSILDAECASVMQKNLEDNGISFMLGDSAARFDGNTAIMKSGRTVEFDVLVLAVGVRANTSLIKDIGGEVNRGIVVNSRMETSVPGIYAAGDCTEGNDVSSGARKVIAILPNAYFQGHTAGTVMAGGSESLENAIPMNSIGFFGVHAMTAGSYTGEMHEEKTESCLKRLFTEDNILKGFIIIGSGAAAFRGAGTMTALIRSRAPLSGVDLELLMHSGGAAALDGGERRKIFGGVV
ncbi:MAG: NAD(P)/FAD-dependent oxidoreductase [Clostridia bacterium]|nr:NAD(P)/FAD-dependent oxidoreductase [Clostridia bacterium]